MNILVVDDEHAVRNLLRRLLERDFNATVLEADDGINALDRLLKEPVDLVLLDLSMKVMGGLETLEAIRRSASYAHLPVVLMTALADEQQVRRAMELGIAGFIVKPFTPDGLRERLISILERQRQDRAAAQAAKVLEIEASHRALIVDQSREFRAIALKQISRLCQAEESDNEFIAMKRCLRGAFDVLIVGATSELSTPESLAQKVRVMPELRRVRLAAAVAPEDAERIKALGVFDAVLLRSFVEDTFDRSLYRSLGQRTLARLLFHSTSPCMTTLFNAVEEGLSSYLGNNVRIQDALPAHSGDARWTAVAVEIQGGDQAWELRVRLPIPLIIHTDSAAAHASSDRLSEEQVFASAGRMVEGIVAAVQPELQARGLTIRAFPARITTSNATGVTSAFKTAGIRRWAVTPQRQVIPVELASISSRETATAPSATASRAPQLSAR